MNLRRLVVKIARVLCCAGLIVAGSVWTWVVIRLLTGFVAGGVDGARGALHQVILAGALSRQIDTDPIIAISHGYERLLVWILITWVLREIFDLLRRNT